LIDLDKAQLIEPTNALIYLNKGIALENIFRWDDACLSWKKAFSLGIEKAGKYIEKQCNP
jgi:Flp pilus assembly protein TadD